MKRSSRKIPYMLVVGEKEAETDSVSVRTRKGTDGGAMSVDEFCSDDLRRELEKKDANPKRMQ